MSKEEDVSAIIHILKPPKAVKKKKLRKRGRPRGEPSPPPEPLHSIPAIWHFWKIYHPADYPDRSNERLKVWIEHYIGAHQPADPEEWRREPRQKQITKNQLGQSKLEHFEENAKEYHKRTYKKLCDRKRERQQTVQDLISILNNKK